MATTAWRAVEGQHLVSTRKLTDSRDEQRVLEDLVERAKPPFSEETHGASLHYLLTTPFRYPPLPHGSRFASRGEPSLWYGSTRAETALAEAAYYRLLFLDGTTAELGPLRSDFSIFSVPLRTRRGVDLSRPPFARYRASIASPSQYVLSQQLGAEMRRDGVECFRYPSARDTHGLNVAAFTTKAFGASAPTVPETWHCVATRQDVEFTRRDVFDARTHAFARSAFEVDGRLPAPAP